MKHKTRIIKTTLFGTHYQAECECGWLSPRSFTVKRYAQQDAREHVQKVKRDG